MPKDNEAQELSDIEQQAEIWYEQLETQKRMLTDYEQLIKSYDAEREFNNQYLLALDREISNIYAEASTNFDRVEELAAILFRKFMLPPRITQLSYFVKLWLYVVFNLLANI